MRKEIVEVPTYKESTVRVLESIERSRKRVKNGEFENIPVFYTAESRAKNIAESYQSIVEGFGKYASIYPKLDSRSKARFIYKYLHNNKYTDKNKVYHDFTGFYNDMIKSDTANLFYRILEENGFTLTNLRKFCEKGQKSFEFQVEKKITTKKDFDRKRKGKITKDKRNMVTGHKYLSTDKFTYHFKTFRQPIISYLEQKGMKKQDVEWVKNLFKKTSSGGDSYSDYLGKKAKHLLETTNDAYLETIKKDKREK